MKENENIDWNIKGLKKENSFKTPDGYFDEFPMRMQKRLEMEKKSSWSFNFSFQRPQMVLAYAFASLILVIGSIWFMNNINTSTSAPFMTSDEIAQFVDNDIMGYDEYMIIDEFIKSGADFSSIDDEISEYDISVDDIDFENILNEL